MGLFATITEFLPISRVMPELKRRGRPNRMATRQKQRPLPPLQNPRPVCLHENKKYATFALIRKNISKNNLQQQL